MSRKIIPVWFGWDGTHILFSQTKDRQKYRNLQREPRVALSIVDPTNPFRYLEIRGKVARIDEDADNKFINSMAKKYINQDVYPNHQPGDERVVVVIVEPEHTTVRWVVNPRKARLILECCKDHRDVSLQVGVAFTMSI